MMAHFDTDSEGRLTFSQIFKGVEKLLAEELSDVDMSTAEVPWFAQDDPSTVCSALSLVRTETREDHFMLCSYLGCFVHSDGKRSGAGFPEPSRCSVGIPMLCMLS